MRLSEVAGCMLEGEGEGGDKYSHQQIGSQSPQVISGQTHRPLYGSAATTGLPHR
jgi:hypothetical protein